GIFDHAYADAVLDAAAWVKAFELGGDASLAAVGDLVQIDERSAANQLGNVLRNVHGARSNADVLVPDAGDRVSGAKRRSYGEKRRAARNTPLIRKNRQQNGGSRSGNSGLAPVLRE